MISPEDKPEFQEFRQELLAIFDEAVRKKTSIREFAIEILTGAIMNEKPYVAIASMLFEQSTCLEGEKKMLVLEGFIVKSRQSDISVIQTVLKLIADGWIDYLSGKLQENSRLRSKLNITGGHFRPFPTNPLTKNPKQENGNV